MNINTNNEYKVFVEVLQKNQFLLKGKPMHEISFIPTYLKDLRLSKNISLKKVGEKTGLSDTYISLIESGKRPLPRLEMLEKICDVYDIKLLELLTMYDISKALRILDDINDKIPIDIKKLVEKYSKLNAENKRMLKTFLSFISEHNLTEQEEPPEDYI